ncbi:related to triacylglycerol lipase II precursor [Phialocephala subalpina]|uniref:Carboxylic ester hydrolase n=1 Tax=Phialocephala subalpina TaxID=576137 RepID=A0A1L7XXP0_9HELO|nr:related to triacylglycerol lipase II precursor [Phialocephala subalpina]
MGRTFVPTCLGLLAGFLFNLATAVKNPVVSTANGDIMGTTSEYVSGVNVFKGIPFGGVVSGSSRWTHPPAASAWNGTLNATTFGPSCPTSMESTGVDYDEDCLYLNVWTPENFTSTSNLPVYFWIYGGRFAEGSGSDLTYEASALAAKDIVVVTINYRLGALGFLAHPELNTEYNEKSDNGTLPSGNYGFHDQLAALHWTNENINLFGGNISQITIGGQSAGAASTLLHVYSPLSTGLFQGAIAESGVRYPHDPLTGSLATSYRNMSVAEAQGVTFLAQLNVTSIADARNLSAEIILSTSNQDTTFVGTPFDGNQAYMEPPMYRPVLDGYAFPQSYEATLANYLQNDVPVMTGNNKDESGATPGVAVNETVYESSNSAIFTPMGLYDKFLELFPASNDIDASNQTNNFYRNQSLVSTHLWANLWAEGGAKSNIYSYYWTHAPPGQSSGAFHGSELNYAFDNMPWGTTLTGETLNWTSTDYQIGDVLSSYWVNFINTGNPNGGDLTKWLPASNTSKTTMMLGNAWATIPVASDDVIEFFEEYFANEISY